MDSQVRGLVLDLADRLRMIKVQRDQKAFAWELAGILCELAKVAEPQTGALTVLAQAGQAYVQRHGRFPRGKSRRLRWLLWRLRRLGRR